MRNSILAILTIAALGMWVTRDAEAAGGDVVVSLVEDDGDGVLIEVADSLLDWDMVDIGENYAISVPAGGTFVSKYAVINPNSIPPVTGMIDSPSASITFTVALWEDVDADGLFGENVDTVLDSDTTDSNGYYSLNIPNNFKGEAGILIYLGDEFDNGDTITGCVGCSS